MDDSPDLTDLPALTPPALLHHSLRPGPDPRYQRRPKHALPDLLFIPLRSLLTGRDSFQDMADFVSAEADWLRTEGGPPSHDTFTRDFALLDTHAFESAVRHWMRHILGGDAVHCRHSLASYVNAQGGDYYVLIIKGNQSEAQKEIHPCLETLAASRPPDREQTEKGHSRLKTRRCWITGDVDSPACPVQWSGLISLACASLKPSIMH